MPWPLALGVVWLGFVMATILAALRWPYRPLALPVVALAVALVAIWIGETFFHWAP
jgi:hypothetical protein